MENIVTSDTRELVIGVFNNASNEIHEIDLAFSNLKVLGLASVEFKDYIKIASINEMIDLSFGTYENMIHNDFGYHPNMYAIVPMDIRNPVAASQFFLIEKILLLMFPSDFRLYATVHYEKGEFSERYYETYSQIFDSISRSYAFEIHPDDLLLKFDSLRIEEINSFVKKLLIEIPQLAHLNIAINSYINSFSQKSLEMAYINHCIALESLTNSQAEVTHRICRTCAVLNSNSKQEGELIYFNANQFYSLRSAIVHGNNFNSLKEYFFELQALVSRTIIESINLGLKSRNEINDFVNQNGYGDKNSFNSQYKIDSFNEGVQNQIRIKVRKYKSN